ncbi:arylamine N-acetyltransferase family protein [Actinokineospora sp. HUAS TT18]|uniref:arylamine N-acetyltransferase family protein n=1 Tax=Actinokineospora sp. HUAS TT18 TaxID=3447451 RepID=UPI003F51FB17
MAKTWGRQVNEPLRDAYLARLGWRSVPPPTLETLNALHRAQVERVPYETVWIALGESRTIDPLDSVRYLLRGRGGYCYHLNGALGTLLDWLGFDVHWRVGGVQGTAEDARGATGNHLVLEVHDGDDRRLVDTGLGDGLHEPVPLVESAFTQGPYDFALRPSETGWRFDHDPDGSFLGMDFAPEQAEVEDFTAEHERLSTSPESGFVRVVTASRRDADSVTELRGRVLKHTDKSGAVKTEIDTRADYFQLLADTFRLPLPDVTAERRDALWTRVTADHEAYLAARAQ